VKGLCWCHLQVDLLPTSVPAIVFGCLAAVGMVFYLAWVSALSEQVVFAASHGATMLQNFTSATIALAFCPEVHFLFFSFISDWTVGGCSEQQYTAVPPSNR
jgi:hypothetical protein